MRPSKREHGGLLLPQVSFPEERIALLCPPTAGRLAADDLEVEVRPATTAPFLAEYSYLLAHRSRYAWLDRRVDRVEM